MNLQQIVDLYFGGPGSGCNPDVGKCGRPPLQGKLEYQGLKISVENKKGSYRRGRSSIGVKWKTKMTSHYGYLRGVTKDNTHEKRDVYVGPHKDSKFVFIVRQNKKGSSEMDEQKFMIGYKTRREAERAFFEHVPGKDRYGGIRPMPIEEFKRKVSSPKYEGKSL